MINLNMSSSVNSTWLANVWLKKQILLLSLIFLRICANSPAQSEEIFYNDADRDSIPSSKIKMKDTPRQIDLEDILHAIIMPGSTHEDTIVKEKGRLYISCLPAIGYTIHAGLIASVGANGAFYTDDVKSENLSFINISPSYTGQHQIIVPILSNIWSPGNNYNFLGNWTYYKYPENTYGLGETVKKYLADPISYDYALIRQTVLKRIFTNFYTGIGYNLDYHWNVREIGFHHGIPTDFDRYGKTKKTVSSGITLNLLYDGRKNPINPPGGFYGNIVYRSNFKFIGSDNSWQSMLIDLRSYRKVPEGSNNVLAFWSYNLFTLHGHVPYLDLPSNGWDTYSSQGRGYTQSRFRGRNLLSFETEYRFNITSNGLLGGVFFGNVQSLPNWPGNRVTGIIPGAGTGIRIKINKHSNTNIALDYGFGIDRSRGMFVNLGEAF